MAEPTTPYTGARIVCPDNQLGAQKHDFDETKSAFSVVKELWPYPSEKE